MLYFLGQFISLRIEEEFMSFMDWVIVFFIPRHRNICFSNENHPLFTVNYLED